MDFLGAMCSGNDQELSDGLEIPSWILALNSFLAAFSSAGTRCRGLAAIAGPVVVCIRCFVLSLTIIRSPSGLVMLGNFAKSTWNIVDSLIVLIIEIAH